MFAPLPSQFSFPEAEERILRFWEEHDVFGRSLAQRHDAPRFVFYEGPPTANGLPHPGHCLTRAIKDLFPRYQTMCGRLVERKAGWDTHGLPVEVEVCKELGIHTKEEIEQYGVEKFVRKCIDSVFRYVKEWEQMTRRLGFWVNLEDAYVTFHQSYVESVWWGLKTLFERGLLYQGHKVVWWWAQGGTALSAGEVGEGYRTVQDPSVYVKFPLLDSVAGREQASARTDEELRSLANASRRRARDVIDRLRKADRSGEPLDESTLLFALDYCTLLLDALLDAREFDPLAPEIKNTKDPLKIALIVLDQFGPESVEKLLAPTSLLVWTTTPWTLISNHFAAVHPHIDYVLLHDAEHDENLIVAKDLADDVRAHTKRQLEPLLTLPGNKLVGRRYLPPFFSYYDGQVPESREDEELAQQNGEGTCLGDWKSWLDEGGSDYLAWRVVGADFVELGTGTGIVHVAPAYGEVDFELLQTERQRFSDSLNTPPLINAVKPDGAFSDEAPAAYRGRWVKDCDKDIIRELKERGVLLHQETIEHEYPFCPRAEDDALIQYARKSWFVRTSQFKDEFLANNAGITWLPEHIKEGRFGDFLRNNVDWALSRERYWGTPLPIWVCEQCGKMEALGSLAELKGKPDATDDGLWAEKKAADPALPDHLSVHKPYIDAWTYQAPCCQGARMRRVPEVIDCWWDAGSMPFAQWGFPHQPDSIKTFANRFPADFISEALDQTRGWFYGMLAISTLLFSEAASKHAMQQLLDSARERGLPDDRRQLLTSVMGLSDESLDPATIAKMKSELLEEAKARGLPQGNLDAMLAAIDASTRTHPRRRKPEAGPAYVSIAECSVDGGAPTLAGVAATYPHPYRACIVLGLMLGEDGLKMSKRKKNYREPSYVFDHYGADAMRWFLFSGQTPWTSVRFEEQNIRDAQREFLVRLYNVFSFFVIYANIDGFEPEARQPGNEATRQGDAARRPHVPTSPRPHAIGWRPPAERSELDRWIISELHRTTAFVRAKLDGFENYPAAGRLNEFVDALSNWYVRRSRDRFWRPLSDKKDAGDEPRPHVPTSPRPHAEDQDKWDAYNTLYEVLVTLSKLIAPFTPFFAEVMYQNLVVGDGQDAEASTLHPQSSILPSVHLCDYPVVDAALIDENLAQEMDLVRDIVSLGRAARTAAKLKVRQPLALAEIILARHEHAGWLEAHSDLIAEELNIKRVEFTTEADHYVTCQLKADFKALGPKFGKLAPQIAAALGKLDPADARATLTAGGELTVSVGGSPVSLTSQEVQVRLEAKPGWSAAQGRAGVVVVKTELTPELIDEGLTRELIHHVQSLRKELQLAYEQRITLYLDAPAELQAVITRFADIIKRECLAENLAFGPPAAGAAHEIKIETFSARLAVVPR